MQAGACIRTALAAGVALSGYIGSPPLTSVISGVASAEAAEFYTRKRVNGVWITGRFPKEGGPRTSSRPARQRVAAVSTDAPVLGVLPPPRDADVTATGSLPAPDEPQSFVAAADERLTKLRDALVARAGEIVAAVPSLAPLVAPPPPAETRAAAPVPIAALPVQPTPAVPAPQKPLEPKSVSYDFERGIKTTVFENSVVREPFDAAAMKGLAGLPK